METINYLLEIAASIAAIISAVFAGKIYFKIKNIEISQRNKQTAIGKGNSQNNSIVNHSGSKTDE